MLDVGSGKVAVRRGYADHYEWAFCTSRAQVTGGQRGQKISWEKGMCGKQMLRTGARRLPPAPLLSGTRRPVQATEASGGSE
ncbi:hypothetical protein GCM10008955_30150 [Deinococcus malanensis]|uniref:Uncharacterized protein n=1 Tax=Deinococcus malanensis TaxID=1706855 RepID=A0ABQ2EZ74_9DEIO|nr:hypothetical protein GCM10008955_30150 [Deinococcus malanensis]